MKKINVKFFLPIILSIFSIIIYFSLNSNNNNSITPYTDFLTMVEKGNIATVTLNDSDIIKFSNTYGESHSTYNPRSENFKEFLLINNIDVKESTEKPLKQTIPLSMLLASLALLIVLVLKDRKLSPKGIFSNSNLNLETVENIDISFDDVAGNEEAKENLKDVIDFLKNPEKYHQYGARMPKGVIFYGEPGTGKTLLAKAVAGEANVPFYAVSGSDFVQMYVGVGASRIRNLFSKARSHGKAVIFIDEIDAIGKQRNSSNTSGSSEEKDQTLNALLTEMSGFNEKEGIIVIAATNRFDMLDNALLRPGRFDRHIEVALPDVNARKRIIDLYLNEKPTKEIDVASWARKTAYFSGAKIENFINEAAILACREATPSITSFHMEKAYSTVIAGSPKLDRSHIKDIDRKITAYHEIGHALTSMLLIPKEEISKISIIPSTKGAGGYTLSIPEDKMYYSKDYLYNKIKVMLGGRAAEEILLGNDYITTGAQNDFQKATSIALDLISKYGMGEALGFLSYSELKSKGFSVDNSILKESKTLLDNLYSEVLQLLSDNSQTLDKFSKLLLEKEMLSGEDITL
ncbi:ATP-dependent metallopeptidase FtsH/Yme1/Tma family protein [Oceanirhabdus seepicola]|uniref:ATP-dependent metallopeptidase FtsH/Yme1/Tma family protein n=1 Tax=Oceanirhabdus seepicola TaxID=2828781 RepID=A0A9J6P323_9CLOT|nr:ATP-dependent metallopeptidase FtsH/Yme1/Tma family protein [Oceanirhabdus seepicola]MCM1990293.1 ATP-dependent metallopeptidase FtsH/Yme1/Tma family protein [Oceanirhabdus seepicola]